MKMNHPNSFDESMYDRIPAKPVIFDGVKYRSKLEAKWGFFFNHIGWRSSYEPITIGRWLPDFVLLGTQRPCRPVFVEVKPIDAFEVVDKLSPIPNYFDILLVGNGPQDSRHAGFPRVGWVRSEGEWGDAMIERYFNNDGKLDFVPDFGFDNTGRMHGKTNSGGTMRDNLSLLELEELWEVGCEAVKRDAKEI